VSKAKPLPPYTSALTFDNFVDKLGSSPPQVVDRSVWGSWLSGASGNQVMNALRFFGMVDEKNQTQKVLVGYLNADGDAKKELLREVLEQSYYWLFDESIDLSSATALQLEKKFRDQGASGSVLPKCVRFFVKLAQKADIPLSPYFTSRKLRTSRPKRKKRVISGTQSSRSSTGASIQGQEKPIESIPLEDKILNMFPEFDPNWSQEAQTTWMERIGELYRILSQGREGRVLESDDESSE